MLLAERLRSEEEKTAMRLVLEEQVGPGFCPLPSPWWGCGGRTAAVRTSLLRCGCTLETNSIIVRSESDPQTVSFARSRSRGEGGREGMPCESCVVSLTASVCLDFRVLKTSLPLYFLWWCRQALLACRALFHHSTGHRRLGPAAAAAAVLSLSSGQLPCTHVRVGIGTLQLFMV